MSKRMIIKTSSMQRNFTFRETKEIIERDTIYAHEDWMDKYPQYFAEVPGSSKDESKANSTRGIPSESDTPDAATQEALDKKVHDEVTAGLEAEKEEDFTPPVSDVKLEGEPNIELSPEAVVDVVASGVATPEVTEVTEEKVEVPVADEEKVEEKTEAVGFKAKHQGFGKWIIVDEEGNKVAPEGKEVFNKQEAQDILATMI